MKNYSEAWLSLMQQHRAIAVIRVPDLELGKSMAKAVAAGGMKLIEITWNSDQPAELVTQLQQELPDCTIGAGTILTLSQLREAIAAGIAFAFTPHINPDLIRMGIDLGIPVIPGALTPTEIVAAWQMRANSVKVFPIKAVGGVTYLRCLREPLGHIPLIPTGGVTLENAPELIAAGAIAVGLAGSLFPKAAIEARNWAIVTQQARHLMQSLAGFQKVPVP